MAAGNWVVHDWNIHFYNHVWILVEWYEFGWIGMVEFFAEIHFTNNILLSNPY